MKASLVGSLLLLLLFPPKGLAQDSLVRINEIKFTSDFEKQAMVGYLKKSNRETLLSLLLATSESITTVKYKEINNRIASIENKLTSEVADKKKNDKKIKIIYDQVHTLFLKKYEIDVRFDDIFLNGKYNCVTATALFALIFDRLNIPYEIKEEPTHVYLLAYPNANNIIVETTSPLFGYLSFDDRFKSNYINILKNQKIIGASEIEKKTTEELFNTYYFKNEKIDLQKLVGIHYTNDALFRGDKGDIKGAFHQMEKGVLLYPASKSQYLLAHFGIETLNKEKLQPKEKALLISKLSRYKAQGITNDMIKGEFINLTNELLARDNNKAAYKDCYAIISKSITDPELFNEIAYLYNYENGRILYNQGNFTSAKSSFEKALSYQPNNIDLQAIFISTIANTFRNAKRVKPALDSLLLFKKRYPTLEQNSNFNSMLANAYVMQFGEYYQQGDTANGEKYKSLFETMFSTDKNITVSSNIIGSAYSEACSYYFKRGQRAKAKALVEKGLEISPDSYELRARQQMLH